MCSSNWIKSVHMLLFTEWAPIADNEPCELFPILPEVKLIQEALLWAEVHLLPDPGERALGTAAQERREGKEKTPANERLAEHEGGA